MSIVELFDMVAGVETGAIMGSALVLKNNKTSSQQPNLWFAKDIQGFFEETVNTFYIDNYKPLWLKFLLQFTLTFIMSYCVYKCAFTKYEKVSFHRIVATVKMSIHYRLENLVGLKVDIKMLDKNENNQNDTNANAVRALAEVQDPQFADIKDIWHKVQQILPTE